MSMKNFSLIVILNLGILLGFSLACGGSGSGASAVSVNGTFDDSATPGLSKTLEAAAGYEATAADLVSGQTFSITIDSTNKTFSTSILARANLHVKIMKNGYEVLSRIFPSSATAGTVSNARINIVTQVQAQMIVASVAGNNYESAMNTVNIAMFGIAAPAETDLRIAKVAAVPGNETFAARIAVMAQLASSDMTGPISSLITILTSSFRQTSVDKIESVFQAAVNSLTDSNITSVYSSVVSSAQVNAAKNGVFYSSFVNIFPSPANPGGWIIPNYRPLPPS